MTNNSHKMVGYATLLTLAASLGVDIDYLLKSKNTASRTNCSKCLEIIPPGKPGRKCESCRKQE